VNAKGGEMHMKIKTKVRAGLPGNNGAYRQAGCV
jgi:hypothetical protein